MRSYRLSVRSRAGAIALGIVVLGIGIVVIVSGIALLIGVAAIAFVLAGGAMLLRKILRRPAAPPIRREGARGFDPALEVFPPEPYDLRRRLEDPASPPPGRSVDGEH